MKLLALDTSSDACSVALQLGDDVIDDHALSAREHTRILVPMIRGLLQRGGVAARDLDAIVLGNGPGSFIGMRIGASVAQGLAHGAGLVVVPVSSLLAVAEEVIASEQTDRVVVAQDARMSEVYVGDYEKGSDGHASPLAPEALARTDACPVEAGGFTAAGAGWDRYPELAAACADAMRARSGVLRPRSRHLLPAGAAGLANGQGIQPENLDPAYLRDKVAQTPS
jgi:tRNA threonylcarbamoyladenosine biosynthesis protein TsaB